ncbi:MAG: hypothetical protein HQK84_04700 [Nitrospinae bacterium]|nr:hypothetical protein [Nitrospinota bacterium]
MMETKIDKTFFTVVNGFDNCDEKAYWLSRSPEERIHHIEKLRRLNFGNAACARLQRVLEVAQRKRS